MIGRRLPEWAGPGLDPRCPICGAGELEPCCEVAHEEWAHDQWQAQQEYERWLAEGGEE